MPEYCSRVDTYATCLLSADQMGELSFQTSLVTAEPLPVATSNVQISLFPVLGSFLVTATRVPSGENAGWAYTPGSPTVFTTFPCRSRIVSWRRRFGGTAITNRSPSRLTLDEPGATAISSAGWNSTLGFPTSSAGEVPTDTAIIERSAAR